MARIRTIKPELFRHEALFEAEQFYHLPLRLAFAGLFTCCDREGRFRWRPRQLKLDILPYDAIDFAHVLDALATRGFLVKYAYDGEYYGCIPSWHKHQCINNKEMDSELPSLEEGTLLDIPSEEEVEEILLKNKQVVTREVRVAHASSTHRHSALESLGYSQGEYGIGKGNKEKEGKRNKEQEGKRNKEQEYGAEPRGVSALPMSVTDFPITIPLHDKTEFSISASLIEEWQQLYPAVDVLQALRHIRGWNLANVSKRKTKSGVLRHITHWLANEQNRGSKQQAFKPPKRFQNVAEHNEAIAAQWLQQETGNLVEGEVMPNE